MSDARATLRRAAQRLDGIDEAQAGAREAADRAVGWDRELAMRLVEAMSVLRTLRIVIESRDPEPSLQLPLFRSRR